MTTLPKKAAEMIRDPDIRAAVWRALETGEATVEGTTFTLCKPLVIRRVRP